MTFQNLYDYHLYLIKKAVHETKINGFFPEDELKRMIKGFEKWKKKDAEVRDLYSWHIPKAAEYQSLVERGGRKSEECLSTYFWSSPVRQMESFPISPPNPEVIASWVFPECRETYKQVWQLEYDLGQSYVKIAYALNQNFFGSVTQKPVMNRAPGAGADEIL